MSGRGRRARLPSSARRTRRSGSPDGELPRRDPRRQPQHRDRGAECGPDACELRGRGVQGRVVGRRPRRVPLLRRQPRSLSPLHRGEPEHALDHAQPQAPRRRRAAQGARGEMRRRDGQLPPGCASEARPRAGGSAGREAGPDHRPHAGARLDRPAQRLRHLGADAHRVLGPHVHVEPPRAGAAGRIAGRLPRLPDRRDGPDRRRRRPDRAPPDREGSRDRRRPGRPGRQHARNDSAGRGRERARGEAGRERFAVPSAARLLPVRGRRSLVCDRGRGRGPVGRATGCDWPRRALRHVGVAVGRQARARRGDLPRGYIGARSVRT